MRPSPARAGCVKGNLIDLTVRPAPRPDLAVAELRGRHVLFDPVERHLYELRADAAALWPALDGDASLEMLQRELADVAAIPLDRAAARIQQILEPLVAAGLIELTAHRPTASRS